MCTSFNGLMKPNLHFLALAQNTKFGGNKTLFFTLRTPSTLTLHLVVIASCCGDTFSETRKLVRVDGMMDGARYWAILEQNKDLEYVRMTQLKPTPQSN